jgi:hypothetical protein
LEGKHFALLFTFLQALLFAFSQTFLFALSYIAMSPFF